MEKRLREIATGLRFPEGPVALADGSVLVVEIARRTLTRVHPDGSQTIVARPGGGPNGAAIGPDGKVYLCNNGGFEFTTDAFGIRPVPEAWDYSGGRIERIDPETGAVEVLYRGTERVRLKGPNDIGVRRAGRLVLHGPGQGARARDRPRRSLLCQGGRQLHRRSGPSPDHAERHWAVARLVALEWPRPGLPLHWLNR